MSKTCKHCGKVLDPGSKSLCLNCYRTRVQWRGEKTIVCKECGEVKKQNAKGLCQRCYSKKYMKKYHADYERQRRKDKAEHIRKLDSARNQKPERQQYRREYMQKYYLEHHEEMLEYQRNYRRADPERRDNYKKRSIARRKNLPDTLTVEQWHSILDRYHHACAYCGKTGVKLEREHKIPAIKGGGYTADNIIPACGECNRRKHMMTDVEFRKFLKQFPR